MDDSEAGRLLGEHARTPPPSPDSLRAIVDRHGRWRMRNLVAVVAVALLAGALGGRLAVRPGSPPPSAGSAAVLTDFDEGELALYGVELDEAEPARAPGAPRPGGEALRRAVTFDRVFVRTADGTAIRAYRFEPPERPPCPEGRTCPSVPPECVPSTLLVPELSNEDAVGPRHPVALFDEPEGTEMAVLHYGVFGISEGAPTQWVAVATGPDVGSVKVTFADGSTDEMQPVEGFAVLAHGIDLPEPAAGDEGQTRRPELGGRIEGTGRSGTDVAGVDISREGVVAQRPEGCRRPGMGGPGAGEPGARGRGPLGGGPERGLPGRGGPGGPGPFGPGGQGGGRMGPQGGEPS